MYLQSKLQISLRRKGGSLLSLLSVAKRAKQSFSKKHSGDGTLVLSSTASATINLGLVKLKKRLKDSVTLLKYSGCANLQVTIQETNQKGALASGTAIHMSKL
jgi:hypothetical protein